MTNVAKRLSLTAALLAALLLAAAPTPTPTSTPGAGGIVLDSNFDDWVGQSFISDPFGDSTGGSRRDIHEFYWANNVDEEYNYWMIARYTTDGQPFDGTNGQKNEVDYEIPIDTNDNGYEIRIDTNDNGVFTEPGDRVVAVHYDPKATQGQTRVRVRSGAGGGWLYDSGNQDWGDTVGEGGLRVELRVAWTYLNVSFGQPTRMYVESMKGANAADRAPDSGDIQWSPASILGPWILAAAAAAGIIAVWYFRGRQAWRRG